MTPSNAVDGPRVGTAARLPSRWYRASAVRSVHPADAIVAGRRAGYPSPPCACPTCSSRRSATTRPTPRCRRIACCCAPGYIRQLGSGIYSLLPLGKRVNDRVEQVIREEQDRIGGQEMEMPVVHPADVWRASGRYDAIGPELARFKDRNGRDMVLAMTHEEVVGILLADIVKSYRQLPMHGLPLPDQVARRAARPRRAHPRPRVRDEGRLQLRPRRGRPRRRATGPSTTPTSGRSSGSGWRPSRSAPTSGSWAAAGPTSSWSSTPPARTSSSCARRAATRPTARSRVIDHAGSRRRGRRCRSRRSRRPGPTTIATLAAFLGIGPRRGPPRPRSS